MHNDDQDVTRFVEFFLTAFLSQVVSFDFLLRRFVAVPKSTLHFDIKQLVKGGYIKKLGITRGAVYSPEGK